MNIKFLSMTIMFVLAILFAYLWMMTNPIYKGNNVSHYTEHQRDTRQVNYIPKSETANTSEIPNLAHLNKAFGNAIDKRNTIPSKEENPDIFDLMNYHFENRDLVAKTFGVEVAYPYRESMNDVLASISAYGYNREEIYKVYRKFALSLQDISIEEVKQNGPKTYDVYEIFNQGRIDEINNSIGKLIYTNNLVPAYILQIDVYRSQNNIDEIYKISKQLVDSIYNQKIDKQYKHLVLGDIIELCRFYAYKDELAIDILKNKSENNITLSSMYLLYFLESGGVW